MCVLIFMVYTHTHIQVDYMHTYIHAYIIKKKKKWYMFPYMDHARRCLCFVYALTLGPYDYRFDLTCARLSTMTCLLLDPRVCTTSKQSLSDVIIHDDMCILWRHNINPANMRCSHNVRLVSDQRRRRWSDTNPTLSRCLVFLAIMTMTNLCRLQE